MRNYFLEHADWKRKTGCAQKGVRIGYRHCNPSLRPTVVPVIFELEEVVPNAMIAGFNKPKMAVEYAKANRVDLAILDIELGTASGLDLCRSLLEINPCTSVVYLTAYPDCSLDAWDTGACGFMVKPLTSESVRRKLKMLRFPFAMGGSDA